MRVTQTPPPALIATHAALTTGVHGVVSPEILNQVLETLTLINAGAGGNAVFSVDSAGKEVFLADTLMVNNRLSWKDLTAFLGVLVHANTATRYYTFPDATLTVVGADTAQLLANKSFDDITIINAGAGADPVFSSNDASQMVTLAGHLYASLYLSCRYDVKFRSGTDYYVTLNHSITAHRTATYPDKTITVAGVDDIATHETDTSVHGVAEVMGLADEKVIQVIPLDDLEISIDTPVATNFSGEYQLESYWLFDSGEQIRTKLTYSPPAGFNKLKIEALVQAGSNTNELAFSYSLNGGSVTGCGADIPVHTNRYVLNSSEIAVTDIQVIRLFLGTAYAGNDSKCYGFKLIWYK